MTTTSDGYIFVLWGNDFDETMATIFVTELRRAGLRVKVVGLSQRPMTGAYGLALLPDLTLEQALPLAGCATCLVIPYTSSSNYRLGNDPRLSEFFEQVHANRAKFIIGPLDEGELDLFPPDIDKVVIESEREDLIWVVRGMVKDRIGGLMQY